MSRGSRKRSTPSGRGARLMFMMSSGGLTAARALRRQGRDPLGPGRRRRRDGARRRRAPASRRSIGFDMGGTSTDVAHFDGTYERAFETEVAGVRMRAPMMKIHTVAAGGGSILHFDGARFRVGPDSAGADPGPTCYRRGGPLAVTDANLMVGKLSPEFFPKIFGPRQDQPLDADKRARGLRRARARDRRRAQRRSRSPTASSPSPSPRWRRRSRRFRSRAAMTSRATRSIASAAPAASTPATSPTRWRSRRC